MLDQYWSFHTLILRAFKKSEPRRYKGFILDWRLKWFS